MRPSIKFCVGYDKPIFPEELKFLIGQCVQGIDRHVTIASPRWCTCSNIKLLKSVFLLLVDASSENISTSTFPFLLSVFTDQVSIFNPSQEKFDWEENLFCYSGEAIKVTENQYLTKFALPDVNVTSALARHSETEKFNRLHLLLDSSAQVSLGYPIPVSDLGYVHLFEEYKPVRCDSPLFALDCETEINKSGESLLSWVALCNEEGTTLFSKKIHKGPRRENEECEIHNLLKKFLTQDAILVGHALSNDLHVLKIFWPYVIDTSVIYNFRRVTPSLKECCLNLLNWSIQTSYHDPDIDAKAALKLVWLKLIKGIEHGDVFARAKKEKLHLLKILPSISKFGVHLSEELDEFTGKSDKELVDLCEDEISMNIDVVILKLSDSKEKELAWFKETDNHIKRIYQKLGNNSAFFIIFTGCESQLYCKVKIT